MTVVSLSKNERTNFLQELGIEEIDSGSCARGIDSWTPIENRKLLNVISPIDGSVISKVALTTEEDYNRVVENAKRSFWSGARYLPQNAA